MAIDVDTVVSVHCDGCSKRKRDDEVICLCHSCDELRKPADGGELRAWADRKLVLGQITREQADFLEHVAKDIELSKPLPKKRAA